MQYNCEGKKKEEETIKKCGVPLAFHTTLQQTKPRNSRYRAPVTKLKPTSSVAAPRRSQHSYVIIRHSELALSPRNCHCRIHEMNFVFNRQANLFPKVQQVVPHSR